MSDIYVTLSGNVTDDPRQYQFRDGSRVTSMRMAVNRRVLDQQTNTWQTRDTTYYTVRCWRGLADNVQQSIRKGHPVVVYGRLRIKQFERDGEQRFWAEIEASSVGHDLKWGIATFEKPIRAYSGGAPTDDDRQAMEDATKEWELTRGLAPRALEGASADFGGRAGGGLDGGLSGPDGPDGPGGLAEGGEGPGDASEFPGGDDEAKDGAAPGGRAREVTAGSGDGPDDADASNGSTDGSTSGSEDADAWLPRALAA
ncbi:single-stranded DNA-binding protein [Microbispora sp. NPDC049125]|uniref:single-stranded DNA-binding protein n=1 Tax=Microbispora sp. NPDC049125 TaxID=3154929 RepID=UPI00346553AC